MPGKGLPTGILSSPYLFVGIKIYMIDGSSLAVYISESKTQVGADQYKRDRDQAKEVVHWLMSLHK